LERVELSEETIRNALKNVGLTEKEAQVYIFLARHGVLKGGEVAKKTRINKSEAYRILKSLRTKGLVESTLESPVRFTAVSFEKVLDSSIKAKQNEAAQIEKTKKEILDHWKNTNRVELEPLLEKFVVIEGNNKINQKISETIKETKNQLSTIITVPGLLRADQFGLFEPILIYPSKKIQCRILTDLSNQNLNSLNNLLKRIQKIKLNLTVRKIGSGLQLSPRMLIRDSEEAVFFISPRINESIASQDEVALWTNCKELVRSFTKIFEEMWRNSLDIKKTVAPESNKTLGAHTIEDQEEAKQNYTKAWKSAEKEIIVMTSSRGLQELSQETSLIDEVTKKGVSIRIMAPIIDENHCAAKQLEKSAEIHHIARGDLGTTIIDGKHLFQFKNLQIDQDISKQLFLGNAYFTDDFEYVSKIKMHMENIWKSSPKPSYVPWKLSFVPNLPPIHFLTPDILDIMKKNEGTNSADSLKDNLKKTQNDKAVSKEFGQSRMQNVISAPESVTAYGWMANGIVQLPQQYKIPMMGIDIVHFDNKSAFGEDTFVLINLWLKTPEGHSFVPVAALMNQEGAMHMRRVFAGTPAYENIVLIEPHKQLEVFRKGNTVFAGWTVNIPLPPTEINLGPSSLFFEGRISSQRKTQTYYFSSGFTTTIEFDKSPAFVTFMTAPIPYVGTGIQGHLANDYVMKTTRPSN
jgi:sugar-specific transcriptional regulator TrmB